MGGRSVYYWDKYGNIKVVIIVAVLSWLFVMLWFIAGFCRFPGSLDGVHMAVPWFSSESISVLLFVSFILACPLFPLLTGGSFKVQLSSHNTIKAIRVDHPQATVGQSARKAKNTMLDGYLLGTGTERIDTTAEP